MTFLPISKAETCYAKRYKAGKQFPNGFGSQEHDFYHYFGPDFFENFPNFSVEKTNKNRCPSILGALGKPLPCLWLLAYQVSALEMAWKVIFKPFFKFFQQFFFINWRRPLSISRSRPSQRPSSRVNVLTISRDEFPQASGA